MDGYYQVDKVICDIVYIYGSCIKEAYIDHSLGPKAIIHYF